MRLCEHRDFQQAIGPQLVSVIAWSGSGPPGPSCLSHHARAYGHCLGYFHRDSAPMLV